MRKLLTVVALAGGALMLAAIAPAGAFGPVQTQVATTAAAMDDVIQVKRNKLARPPGWSRGRKVGWRGGHRPPGQR